MEDSPYNLAYEPYCAAPARQAARAAASERSTRQSRLPSSHPISLRLPSMGVFDTDWEWPASATCPRNGLVSARCLVYRCGSHHIGPLVFIQDHLHRGNGIPRPRDKPPKIAFRPETVSAETETQPQKPANCGLLGRLREISRFERVRGGPERTRTACQARSHTNRSLRQRKLLGS